MSYICFHSPSGNAKVSGAEQHNALSLCSRLFGMVLGVPGHMFTESNPYRKLLPTGAYPLSASSDAQFFQLFATYIGPGSMILGDNALVHPQTGAKLDLYHLGLNTAVAMGSDPVRLLAKLAGQCEIHAYVEGKNRAWLADIIEAGVRDNILRTWKQDQYPGWPGVVELLRSRDNEPVVASYSVTNTFPNYNIARTHGAWAIEVDHNAIRQTYHLEEDDDPAEWESSYLSDRWYDLPEAERWDRAMAGLHKADEKGYLEIKPETLGTQGYGNGISAFDLMMAMMEVVQGA